MKWSCAFLLYCLLAIQPAWSGSASLRIGSHIVSAEIAATPESREQGLMGRKHLCANCGMLFAFPVADRYGFWMKNTLIPLSIAFIAPDGSIVGIEDMQPNSGERHYYPKDKALYALEMNLGWFAQRGIKEGNRVLGVKNVIASR